MSPKENVRVDINGDVYGQVAVGDHIVQIGNVNGVVVNVSPIKGQPAYQRRSTPVHLRPRASTSLLDREQELVSASLALDASLPISIYGDEGIGKTSFVRKLAHLPNTDNFADGVVYLDSSGAGLDDLLQSLFDVFHESQSSYLVKNSDVHIIYKPTASEIRIAIKNLRVLIFIDNYVLPRNQTEALLDAFPHCTFVFSAVERSLWGEGKAIALGGLPEQEALALFERELGRALNGGEQVCARELVAVLACHPLRILQVASLIREKSKPIADMLLQLKGTASRQSVIEVSLNSLTETQKKMLAILAASGGSIVPSAHLAALVGGSHERGAVEGLLSLSLVQAHSPRYSLTGDLSLSLADLWDLSTWEDALINYLTQWLLQKPQEVLVEESTDLVISTVRKAAGKKRWREVIQMGRAMERYLALWKRWQTWAEILDLILDAAKALDDRKVEAWALHQLGSRATGLGMKDQALKLLNEALSIRTAIGDKAGVSVTQHNLNILRNAPLPLPRKKTGGCSRWLIFAGIAAVVVLSMIVVAVLVLWPRPPGGSSQEPFAPPVIATSLTATLPPSPVWTASRTVTVTRPPSVTPSRIPTRTLLPTRTVTLPPTATEVIAPSTLTPNATPLAVQRISPANGSTICSGSGITLKWNEPYDASGIAFYDVQLVKENVVLVQTTVFAPTTQLFINENKVGDYGWTVRAQDKEGAWGYWDNASYNAFKMIVCIN